MMKFFVFSLYRFRGVVFFGDFVLVFKLIYIRKYDRKFYFIIHRFVIRKFYSNQFFFINIYS